MGLYLAARHFGLSAADAAHFSQTDFDNLETEERARLSVVIQKEIKTNRYDPEFGVLKFTQYQSEAFGVLSKYYTSLFKNGPVFRFQLF